MKKKQSCRALRLTSVAAAMSLAVTIPANARQLTPQESLQRAEQSESGLARRAPSRIPVEKMKLVYTGGRLKDNSPAFYVFNHSSGNNGYVITSADSRLRAVLATADSGSFDASDIPENVKWWLSQYETEAAAYLAQHADEEETCGNSIFENYAQWEPVAPIVTTNWNQDAPYNNLCPEVNGTRTVTGCVATAMAQVVKAIGFYDGKNKISYTSSKHKNPVSFDFAGWKCDFSQMLDNYGKGSNATAEQINQVATLMYACAAAVNTNFGLASEGGSGAGYPINGLVTYFGYDKSSTMLERSHYQTAQWEEIIYRQLQLGRPLVYVGSGSGGHSFVCDGYSEDGYFHFNWGWGGVSNGYYALSVLNPRTQGIGGFDGGYNLGQAIGIFVKPGTPAPENTVSRTAPCGVVYQGTLQVPTIGKTIDRFSLLHTLSYTPDGKSRRIGMSLLLENADGVSPEIFIKPRTYSTISIFDSSHGEFSVNMADVPAGTYYAYPAFAIRDVEGYWKATHYYGDATDHFLLTVGEDGKRTYSTETYRNPGLAVCDMAANDWYVGDNANTFSCLLVNGSRHDFIDNIGLRLETSAGAAVKTITTTPINIHSGETRQMSVNFDGKNLSAGQYVVRLYIESKGGVRIGETSLAVRVRSGSRPIDRYSTTEGMCEIALWENNARKELGGLSVIEGGSLSGTTSLNSYMQQKLDYYLAIFRHGESSNPICRYNIANKEIPSCDWSEGDSFNITPELAPGLYTAAFVDANGTRLSPAVDFNVLIEENGLTFRMDTEKTVATYGTLDSGVTSLTIPSSVRGFDVTKVDAGALARLNNLESLTLPASLVSTGVDAFRGCYNLKHVFFSAPKAPFVNSAVSFYGVTPLVEFYVNEGDYSEYRRAFTSQGNLYSLIDRIEAPTTVDVNAESSVEVRLNVTPSEHFNPRFEVVSNNSDAATATLSGSTLTINGIGVGESEITVTSAQPGVDPVRIKVNVSEPVQDGIDEITLDTRDVEYFDLSGRRISKPRGLHIRRTHGSKAKVVL